VVEKQLLEPGGRDLQRLDRFDGLHGSQPLLHAEERHFTEEVSRPQAVKAAAYVQLGPSLEEDIHAIAWVSRLNDIDAGIERYLLAQTNDVFEITSGKARKQRHRFQHARIEFELRHESLPRLRHPQSRSSDGRMVTIRPLQPGRRRGRIM
jgi:hypothetical protein